MTVAVLFARSDSVYYTLPDVEVYDIERDARTYDGPWPVVAHPPCKRWSSLNNLVLARYPHRAADFAHGNDGGLFELALGIVRRYGGVLEHPAFSRAWRAFDLPRPTAQVWQRGVCGGWAVQFDQRLFGHTARKLTWLYAVTDSPPALPRADLPPVARVVRVYRRRNSDGTWSRQHSSRHQSEITHAAAEHTPIELARWLVELAGRCRVGVTA